MSRIRIEISKEALALSTAVVLVAGALLVGQQSSITSEASAPVAVRESGANTVVAVNTDSAESARTSWNATALRTLPGSVLLLPPVSATSCADTEVVAARAAEAIAETAQCISDDPNPRESTTASLAAAVEASKGRVGSLVLLGQGWTGAPPVAIDPSRIDDPIAVALAIREAQLAGAIPDMEGIDVVMAGPPPSVEVRRAWDQYFAIAGANSVEWAVSRASATPAPEQTPASS
jgi:hypothetical protein